MDSDKIQKNVVIYSEALHVLGTSIASMGFSYEIEYKTKKEYWKNRMTKHVQYFEKSIEYYNKAHTLMKLVNYEHEHTFLDMLDKFQQLKTRQLNLLEHVSQSPAIMASKDRQQSKWSKNVKENLIDNSNKCLEHEKNMSRFFKKFFKIYVQDMLGV